MRIDRKIETVNAPRTAILGRAVAADTSSTLVGRDAELDVITSAMDRAWSGAVGITVLEGVPGIGKSRLLQETGHRGRAAGFAVISAACHELEVERSFGPWNADAVPTQLEPVAATLRVIQDSRAVRDDIGTPWQRFGAAEQLAAAMIEASSRHPVALLVDDLQWADAGTILALSALARRAHEIRLFLAVCLRPDPRPNNVRALLRDLAGRNAIVLSLGPLAPSESKFLAERLIGTPQMGPKLERLVEGAGGSPLLIRELINALNDANALGVARGSAEVTLDAAPETLRTAVLQRLDYLPSSTLTVLKRASVFGGPFRLDHLAAMLEREPMAVSDDLAPAIRAGLLLDHGERCDFAHDLIRAALYDDISPAHRPVYHRTLGLALIAVGAEPELIATHLSLGAASGDELAIDWLRRASRQILSTAPEVAADLLTRASAIVRPDQGVAHLVTAELATALVGAGQAERAEKVCRTAIAQLPQGPGAWRVHQALAEALYWNERYRDATRELEIGLVQADPAARPRMLAVLADALVAEGDFERGRQAAEEALGLVSSTDTYVRWLIPEALAYERFLRGYFSEAIPFARRALDAAHEAGPASTWFSEPAEARYFIHADLVDECEGFLSAGLAAPERARWPAVVALRELAATYFVAGRWNEMEATYQRSEEVGAGEGIAMNRIAVLIEVTRVAVRAGDLERASRLLDECREDHAGSRIADLIAWTEALIIDARGDPAAAISALERGVDVADSRQFLARYRQLGWDVVRISIAGNRPDLAEHAATRLEELARRAGVASVEGLALQCRGYIERDPALTAAAVTAYRRSPRRYELGRACETHGIVALERPDLSPAAIEALVEAAEIYRDVGARADALRVFAVLRQQGVRRVGGRRHAKATFGWDALTASEVEVLGLLANGLTNAEIAKRLFVSKRTVETHVTHAYVKLGAATRMELARAVDVHRAQAG